jgi:hypothetical protein
MKLLPLIACLLLAACASSPNQARYKEEKNSPKFGNSRSYVETPQDVLLAARAVLDDLTRESDPPASGAVKGRGQNVQTGWVYSISGNRYVEYSVNGTPRRKPLRIRRKYGYTVSPSLAGSQVLLSVEEELMRVDLRSGEETGWSSVKADSQAYDMLSRRLGEKIRSR